jgi:hypothetical protein
MQMNVKMMIAAGATIFVSIVAVAVFTRVSGPAEAVVPPLVATEVVVEVAPTARTVVDAATVAQREADYQTRLAEANRVIAQAATDLQQSRADQRALVGQYNAVVNSAPVVVAAPIATAPVVAPVVAADPVAVAPVAQITLEAAQGVAQAIAPSAALLRTPELVMYENAMAYEFVFDKGTVYIAASDGALVYNGIAVMQAAQQAAAKQPSSNHESDDNQESESESEDNQEQGDHDD